MPPYLPDIFPSVLENSEIGLSNYPNEAHPSYSQTVEPQTATVNDEADIQRSVPLTQVIDKIADGQRVPPQITMRYEMLRFCTLRSYPKENKPFITRIAQAGFCSANNGDEVVCYCCKCRKSNWREEDNPMDIHRQLNPNCDFLLRNSEVNVPNGSGMPDFLPDNAGQTTSPQLRNENSTETTATCNKVSQNPSQTCTCTGTSSAGSTDVQNNAEPSTLNPSDNGANRSATPKYPKYASKTVRVTSFNDCGGIIIPPDSLAASGFFYAGFGDSVRCFQCGVGLRHWCQEDDPWIEHSRWSKDCAFVRQIRGQEFVNLVQMAVQYQQNQAETEQTPGENTTGTNLEAAASSDIENLMHIDAAQSVLEMGLYHPDIIQRAIQAIREINGTSLSKRESLTADKLMEKILALEEADNSANNRQNVEPLQQSPTSLPTQSASELPSVGTNADNSITRSQGSAEVNSAASARDNMPSVSAHSGGPKTTVAENDVSTFTGSSVRSIPVLETIEHSQVTCDLIRENQHLRYQNYCINCGTVLRDVVFLSCLYPHLALCHNCFMYFDRCPLCDTKVKALMDVER